MDVASLLKYEFAPVPCTLFHLDGKMRKTGKSASLTWLHDKEVSVKVLPPLVGRTLLVIGVMMLLRMICTEKCECKTFGELSDKLLVVMMGQQATFTAVVGDNYHNDSSIKSEESSRWGVVEMQEI